MMIDKPVRNLFLNRESDFTWFYMRNYVKLNKLVYDELAEEYKLRLNDYIISDRKIAAPFIDYLKNKFKRVRILELGPGSGLNLSFFESEGFKTTAINISKNITKVAKEIAPKTKFIHTDFLDHDFGNSKFEGIFAKAFIHLFPKKDALLVLDKIKKLLVAKGAAFIATTVHKKSEEGYFEKIDYKKKLKRFRKKWTEKELIQAANALGLEIINKGYHIEPDKNKKWVNLVVIKS